MTTATKPSNSEIPDQLERMADLLEKEEENYFRIQAYRIGDQTVRYWKTPVADLAETSDLRELQKLPGIGKGISAAIAEYVQTGHIAALDRMETEIEPVDILTRVPGLSRAMAREIYEQLGIQTLEELELAAHDGRLESLKWIGPKRIQDIQTGLIGVLSKTARRRTQQLRQTLLAARKGEEIEEQDQPSVKTILDIDAEYRQKAEAGELKTIAPKRFNPGGETWLPVLSIRRKGWNFTALYSNTPLAHEQNATHDWVVIYYNRDGEEDQCTVVTGERGVLEGKRVIRGRENECRIYYTQQELQNVPF